MAPPPRYASPTSAPQSDPQPAHRARQDRQPAIGARYQPPWTALPALLPTGARRFLYPARKPQATAHVIRPCAPMGGSNRARRPGHGTFHHTRKSGNFFEIQKTIIHTFDRPCRVHGADGRPAASRPGHRSSYLSRRPQPCHKPRSVTVACRTGGRSGPEPG